MGREHNVLRTLRATTTKSQDLRTATSHLECARAALSCTKASVAAAYVELALYHCQLEMAAAIPAPRFVEP